MSPLPADPPPTRQQRAGCLVRAGRVFVVLLAGLLLLAGVGTVYESAARAQELSGVTAAGQLVDIGGHTLHLVCMGQPTDDQPTVLLEAGVGGWSSHWHRVQPAVAQFARVCAYDRAGYGWSEAGPRPRDGQRIVAELHTLLERSGERGPFVLVGASRGGQYVRLYQAAYPAEVAGLVLVDAEPEDMRLQSTYTRNAAAQNPVIFSVLGVLSRMGVLRLLGGDPASAPDFPCLPALVKSLPGDAHAAYVAVEGQPRCFAALVSEEAATEQREAQVRDLGSLDDLPLLVLTRRVGSGGTAEQTQAEQVWQTLQTELVGHSTRGTQVHATSSGHNIAIDQPELVIEAIARLVEEGR